MKSSPYVGVFRHAPSFTDQHYERVHVTKKSCRVSKCHQIGSIKKRRVNGVNTVPHSPNNIVVSGKLLGGAHDDFVTNEHAFVPSTWLDEKISDSLAFSASNSLPYNYLIPSYRTLRRLQMSLASHSALLTLLTLRLPNIFRRLFPQCSEEECEHDDNDDEYSNESDSSSNSHQKNLPQDEEYNRNLALLLDLMDASESHDATQRLDYMITQTDISRMARNASRHLDVASILSLPTVTFESPLPMTVTTRTKSITAESARDNNLSEMTNSSNPDDTFISSSFIADGSWLVVPSSKENSNIAVGEHAEEESITSDEETEEQSSSKSEDVELNRQQSCVICLENFHDGDKLRVLPCGHLFHTGCVDHWLLGTYSDSDCVTTGCPMCKKRAITCSTILEQDLEEFSANAGSGAVDGSVPSWAFARLGAALIKESDTIGLNKEPESLAPFCGTVGDNVSKPSSEYYYD
mmetsp:Transcript_17324/g.25407  ORF Transcript_17324/g.25407 Transcript_17324/m.25407 type:complete len:464 (-) Transcript_17324:407-1798(-)|eukprot:CAMPEP_0195522056 /NCGR_PEP_ID=MMETSP0794_2-20130614/19944_1 /TAXON_ID=515487 /ORGANISM="Stephanopyxis turris, Strain CCMP 815" /LENGTH=463 /DNA_ID=CAMNT_0040651735 /DNA_START=235 /DNA_END=1626 /DNA_ORIENTATION=+